MVLKSCKEIEKYNWADCETNLRRKVGWYFHSRACKLPIQTRPQKLNWIYFGPTFFADWKIMISSTFSVKVIIIIGANFELNPKNHCFGTFSPTFLVLAFVGPSSNRPLSNKNMSENCVFEFQKEKQKMIKIMDLSLK